jgi:hypothetical protein
MSVLTRSRLAGRLRSLVAVLVAGSLVGALAASSARAGLLDSVLTPCGDTLSQPFLPWLDPALYAFTPNGGLENGLSGWTTSGGAKVVAGNETYAVHGAADTHSLALPAGSTATTGQACVGTLSPTARLFVRNTGSLLSTLKVDVLYTTALGIQASAPIGVLTASSSWRPTLPMLLLANVTGLPLTTSGSTQIALRFTAEGSGCSWQVDDVYLDPYKGT